MAKKRRPIVDYLVYLGLRLFVALVQALTPDAGRSLARAIGGLVARVDRRHREIALDNLRRALPGRFTEDQLGRLVVRVYQHFMMMIVEIAQVPRKIHPTTWRRYISLDGAGPVVDLLLEDRPVIMLTGHFGNWEMVGYVFGLYGFPTYSVARPLDNPHVDRFIRRFREATGQRLIPKKGGYDQMLDVLHRGGTLAFLADQDAGERGLFVEFFGRPASTHKAIALLAIEHGATIVVGGGRRRGDGFAYENVLMDVIRPADLAGTADDARVVTQRFTAAIERMVRRDPDQYLWLHRRWKSQPRSRRAPKRTGSQGAIAPSSMEGARGW